VKACVTGATGFVGAHVARALAERGDEVRVTYRDEQRLAALDGVGFRRAKTDVLDFAAMRRAVRGTDVLFHTAGYVGSRPAERLWQLNALAPVVAVEAAAAEGVGRVVVTSTVSAIGAAAGGEPLDETAEYPRDWLHLAYPDSKHIGEQAALAAGRRHGIDVVVVNPAYVLGVPVNRSQPGETSTRTIGNYLRGRLPAVVGSAMNFCDVEDVAVGHLLAASEGRAGERYILGSENLTWPGLVDRVARFSGVRLPVMVLHPGVARVGRMREAVGLPGILPAEAVDLMGRDWRFTSDKARRELGYEPRPINDTIKATTDWYLELIGAGTFDDSPDSALSRMAGGVRLAAGVGLVAPLRLSQRVVRRRFVAGV
jgi:dihydroflavonol-4-reductase